MHTLIKPGSDGVSLRQLPPIDDQSDEALTALCKDLAASDPWRRLAISPRDLRTSLSQTGPDTHAFTVMCGGANAGVLKLRQPWLFGIYIELLGLLDHHRGQGLGQTVVEFVETRARNANLQNVWICVSEFNTGARRFYARAGYSEIAELTGLVVPNENEMFLRKRL